MSDAVSALGGATFEGYVRIRETGPVGMITLRCKHEVKALAKAVKAVVGVKLPGKRRIEMKSDKGAAWMSPDELLLLLPYEQVQGAILLINEILQGEHALVVDVSDARAVFRLEGAGAREVLRKLCPVDLSDDAFGPGEIRRTRAAQVAVAFWMDENGFTLVSFRSVAAYVMGLLSASAKPGGEVGLF